ncbi:MAG: hypothetical protein ISN28_00485 [Ectothiorhodospiraceae bacterium AqS1]|nr:hypothetical protein [Ectothiorhodospiraceae bacterium AqS1]
MPLFDSDAADTIFRKAFDPSARLRAAGCGCCDPGRSIDLEGSLSRAIKRMGSAGAITDEGQGGR